MPFPSHIFRSYDIRGLLAEVTPELARQVGFALVAKTSAKIVVVGRDMRSTSPELAQAAIEGIRAAGADVRDIGMCTTSMFNFAVSAFDEIDAGLMVTASHNPPEYNGIKTALASGLPISGKEMYGLVENVKDVKNVERVGNVEPFDILETYLDRCIELVKPKYQIPNTKYPTVVVDYGNGMGAVSVRPLLEKFGVEVIELYPEPDARFPHHEANPAKDETLADLKAAVVREGAALGIALDGDADRVGFVDNEGVSLRGDLTLALLAEDLLKTKPGAKIVVAPNQSWATMETIEKNGGVLVSCPIGRTNAIAAMQREAADLGGEVSSHFFYKEFSCLESVDHTIVRVLSILARRGKTFADLVRPLRRYANSGEVNVEVHDKEMVLRNLEAAYTPHATLVNKLDGIRCEFHHDWWFIVRASNTEPLLRITVEATSQKLMQEKLKEISAQL